MAMKVVQTQESINPNIIPMIDIMFLLLLFFMLGADMGQREFEEVFLPVANDVKEDTENRERPITVNVYHVYEEDLKAAGQRCDDYENERVCVREDHWKIGIRGTDYAPNELHDALDKLAAPERGHDPANPLVSEKGLQIRADRSAIYGHVQKVMNACAEVGIYKVEIGAAAKVDDKPHAE